MPARRRGPRPPQQRRRCPTTRPRARPQRVTCRGARAAPPQRRGEPEVSPENLLSTPWQPGANCQRLHEPSAPTDLRPQRIHPHTRTRSPITGTRRSQGGRAGAAAARRGAISPAAPLPPKRGGSSRGLFRFRLRERCARFRLRERCARARWGLGAPRRPRTYVNIAAAALHAEDLHAGKSRGARQRCRRKWRVLLGPHAARCSMRGGASLPSARASPVRGCEALATRRWGVGVSRRGGGKRLRWRRRRALDLRPSPLPAPAAAHSVQLWAAPHARERTSRAAGSPARRAAARGKGWNRRRAGAGARVAATRRAAPRRTRRGRRGAAHGVPRSNRRSRRPWRQGKGGGVTTKPRRLTGLDAKMHHFAFLPILARPRGEAKRAAPHRSSAALGQGTRPAARTHTHTHSALRPHPAPRSPTQRPGKSAPPSDCLSSEIDPHLLRDSVLPRQPVAPRRVWAWGPWTCRSTTRSNSARETRPQPSGWPQAARARRGS